MVKQKTLTMIFVQTCLTKEVYCSPGNSRVYRICSGNSGVFILLNL